MNIGDTVKIINNNVYGKIEKIIDNKVIINCNNKLITTNIQNIELYNIVKKRKPKYYHEDKNINYTVSSKPQSELMIRHQSVLEAMENVEKFLDTAIYYKLPIVKIIHGKHGGILKAELHKLLDTLSFVDYYTLGDYHNGQNGVTIIYLKFDN